MKKDLMEMIRCLSCGGKFDLEVDFQEIEIKKGKLKCKTCSSLYQIIDGIVVLLNNEVIDESKKKEIEGWSSRRQGTEKSLESNNEKVDDMKKEDLSSIDYLLSLPYINKNSIPSWVSQTEIKYWEKVSSCFDICLKKLNLNENLKILEVGAGSGWACGYFSKLGCYAIANDICFDNLTDAIHFVEMTDSYFERVVGDAEDLPFEDELFDVVFACATLHHSSNPTSLVRELKRVLRKGGVIFIINEPLRPITRKENDLLANNEEKKLGINEHIFSYFEYKKAFLRNMMPSKIFLEEFESKSSFEGMVNWIKSEDGFKYRVCNLMFKKELKPILELFWMLFLGGNLNIYAKKI